MKKLKILFLFLGINQGMANCPNGFPRNTEITGCYLNIGTNNVIGGSNILITWNTQLFDISTIWIKLLVNRYPQNVYNCNYGLAYLVYSEGGQVLNENISNTGQYRWHVEN